MEHQQETAYGESNRHVINDVTCVVTPIYFGLNISQTAGDTDSVTMEHLQQMVYGYQVVIKKFYLMTSRDLVVLNNYAGFDHKWSW